MNWCKKKPSTSLTNILCSLKGRVPKNPPPGFETGNFTGEPGMAGPNLGTRVERAPLEL